MTTPKTEARQEGPKVQDSPEFKEALRQATSKYQSETSRARKESKDAQAKATDMETRMKDAQQEIEVARLAGDDEEEAKRIRERMSLSQKLDQRQRELDERASQIENLARKQTIAHLSARYKIPAEELETYETANEMVVAAKDRYIEELEKLSDEKPVPRGPGFDVGAGRVAAPSVDWVKLARDDPKEFDRRAAEVTREAARRRR